MFQIGEIIEARFGGKAKYYGGKITNINGDGSYHISYDDGDTEMAVDEAFIRKIGDKKSAAETTTAAPPQPLAFQKDSKVQARFGGKAKYYGATVVSANEDGTYDLHYDDGDNEKGVKEELIKAVAPGDDKKSAAETTAAAPPQPLAFQKDSKVQARFGGKAKYYGATVVSANEDGTYDLHYDDGDNEKGVKEELIKAVASADAPEHNNAAQEFSQLAITTTVDEPNGAATVLMSTGAYDVGADQALTGALKDDDDVDLYGADDAPRAAKSFTAPPQEDYLLEPGASDVTQGLPETNRAIEASVTEPAIEAEVEVVKKPADSAKDLREATAARLARRTAKLEGLSESALAAKAASLRASSLEPSNDSDGSDNSSSGRNRNARNHRKSYFRPPGEGEGAALAAAAHARASWQALSPSLPRRAAVRDLLPPVFLAALDGATSDWKRLVSDHERHYHRRGNRASGENGSGAVGLLCLADGEGRRPLHYAALGGKVSFIRCVLASARAELDAKLDHQLAALRTRVRNAVHRAWDSTMENECGGNGHNTTHTTSSNHSSSKQVGFAATTVTALRASAAAVDPSPRRATFGATESSSSSSYRLSPAVEAVAFLDWACGEADRLGRLSELECEGTWHRLVAARDSLGRTPLFYAASGGNNGARAGACLEALLDANSLRADFRARSPGLVAPPSHSKARADFKQWHALVSTPEDLLAKSGQWFHRLFQRRTAGGANAEASENNLTTALQMMDYEDSMPPKVSGCLSVRLFPAQCRFFLDDGRLESGSGALFASNSTAEREIAALTKDLTSNNSHSPRGNHNHLHTTTIGFDDKALDGSDGRCYNTYAEDSAAALLPSENVVCGWAQRTLCLTAGRLARASGSSRYAVLRRAFTSEGSGAASTHCLSVPELSRVLARKLNFTLSLDALETLAWRFRWRSAKGKALQVDIEPLIEFVLQAAPSRESGSEDDDDGTGTGSGSGSGGGGYSDDSESEYGRRNNSSRWGESKESGGEGQEESEGESKDNGKENDRRRNGRRKHSKHRSRVKSRKPPPPILKQEPEPTRLLTTAKGHSENGDDCEHSTKPLWPPKNSGAIDAATIVALRVAVVDSGDATGGFSAMHVASLRGFSEAVAVLSKFGAARSAQSGHESALEGAVNCDNSESNGGLGRYTALALTDDARVRRVLLAGGLAELDAFDEHARKRLAGLSQHHSTQSNALVGAFAATNGGASSGDGSSGVGAWVAQLADLPDASALLETMGDAQARHPLHLAATAGLEPLTTRLLEGSSGGGGGDNCNPNVVDAQGWTPLQYCALHGGAGRRAVATALLDAGADLDKRTPCRGRTALHLAALAAVMGHPTSTATNTTTSTGQHPTLCYEEDAAMVRLLAANGANLEAVDSDGKTALTAAASAGRVKCCEALLESGANPYHFMHRRSNSRSGSGGGGGDQSGRGALHWACAKGQALAARLLAQWDGELGLHTCAKDAKGLTPVALAASHPDPVKSQAAQRALVSPWACAREGDVTGLQRLLVNQHQLPLSAASTSSVDDESNSYDHENGLSCGSVEVFSACITPPHLWAPVGFEAKGPLFGCTPLMLACLGPRAPHILLKTLGRSSKPSSSSGGGDGAIASGRAATSLFRQRLLAAARKALAALDDSAMPSRDATGRPKSASGRGNGRGAAAATSAQARTVEFLLTRCGVYVDAADLQGRTALMLLCVAAGDDARQVRSSSSSRALKGATPSQASSVATALLRAGARVAATDLHGNTALHYAFAFSARQGGDSASGLLSLLLAAGAQANARNFAGQTPKDVLGSGGSICQDLL